VSVRVKVCGLRRAEDVERCAELGVDMYGFNCWPGSPRFVPPAALPILVRDVPAVAEVVLVFVRSPPSEIAALVQALEVPASRLSVQLHGDEDPREYEGVGVRVVQVLRVGAYGVPTVRASRVLVDAHSAAFGGTGARIHEEALVRVRPLLPSEWILAGGLDAARVGAAIERFRPWGVDVASGVETEPGAKDHEKLGAFVAAVRLTREREEMGEGERC